MEIPNPANPFILIILIRTNSTPQPLFLQEQGDALTLTLSHRERGLVYNR